jgi:glyoxylase-like metal-dependent hydrolase (beta-lactamase superfamily II)
MTVTVDYVNRFPLAMEWEYEQTNVYHLDGGDEHWLIDTGEIHEDNFEVLTEYLRGEGLTWSELTGVLVTHLHPDHVGLIFEMLEENPDLDFRIPTGASMGKRTPERTKEWLRRVGMPEAFHEAVLEEITNHKYVDFMRDVKDRGRFLEPGTTLRLGSRLCEVLPARGHTPNQVVYYLPEDGLLFSGDHVLLNETPNVSVFPEYLDGNPLRDFHEGLEGLLDLDISVVYPGHGPPFQNGKERVRELLEHHEGRLDQCRRIVEETPQSPFEVADQIPWSSGSFEDLKQVHQFLALGETFSHLEYLRQQGKLEKSDEDGTNRYYQ